MTMSHFCHQAELLSRKPTNAAPKESAIEMRQRQAAAAKAAKMQRFADEAKEGKKDTGIREQAIREKRQRADEEKQRKIKQLEEVGQAMTSALGEGSGICYP